MSAFSSLTVGGRCSVTVTPDELLAALQRGDDDAYRRLVNAELEGLYALSYRILGNRADAEDVCQEVLTKLYQSAATLHSGTVVRAWLRRVCVNACLNVRRRRRKRAYAEFTDDFPSPADTGDSVEDTAFRRAVQEALQQLSPRQRATFVLRHLQECSVKETAEIMGCAEGTVKVQFSRAVLRLRGLLRDWYDVEAEGV